MPVTPLHPGLYVQEIPSGVHPISGVSTSDTAFVDFFPQGPIGVATRVSGFEEFVRRFGPPDPRSPASYGVLQFFVNGGQTAWIVRVTTAGAVPSRLVLPGGSTPSDTLVIEARSPGAWGDQLQVAVDWNPAAANAGFTLAIRRLGQVGGRTQVIASEVHRDLTMGVGPRYFADVVNAESALVRATEDDHGMGQPPTPTVPATPPDPTAAATPAARNGMSPAALADPTAAGFLSLAGGNDGSLPGAQELKAGLLALGRIEPAVVNLLCIPAAATLDGLSDEATPNLKDVADAAAAFCETFRCFYLVDIPQAVDSTDKAEKWLAANSPRDRNTAVYFPRLKIVDPDPARGGALLDVAASGTLAGLFARTDAQRGIWKAPAGTASQLRGVIRPAGEPLNDADSAALNPLGMNVIRTLPVHGTVSWGARTLFGADAQASEWKYVPIRRTALYIEESLVQGLRWVVFEPNDEPLWAQIRLNVGAFLQSMFRQGAFQGRTPREAYLVKCDSQTTTQADIDRGIVNILVGFAPLKPAEFVVIQLQQLTRPPE
ncbi:phage tail sheath family protein [Frankia sp. CNm7]|uniref:Phage tail sheath family protein n=1 Tax=Frankia nepalensis TaxID=1836974 RepID=A0A937UW02_9ACTN|nr:phage tail sheath C-terminal domain-containing protein [Frankia nepalensis]MBL7501505.1 phage tail sheath family protein [Frankia nepalensis]MBL7513633.1 phage tail sheath family protein [Frankia nepalensis]MBL7520050.1 phage tail sheath family protein [Frankia nepalensis]MBL7633750.1 phage tail sheath family protein [Frankia nepalensis]